MTHLQTVCYAADLGISNGKLMDTSILEAYA
jgi:hypothetical protein